MLSISTYVLACTTQDPAERKLKLTTELNNGRLAMVAMTAMLIQSGTPSGDQLQGLGCLGSSPLLLGSGTASRASRQWSS